MPYANNDQLPDDVKSVLPDAAQTIWREAFNAAVKDKPEAEAVNAGWAAVKNAGFKKGDGGKWAKAEKDDGGNTHEFDAEIFSVGTWNGDKYTADDLDDMVANFAALKDEVKPPIKLGHGSSQFGQPGKVALGWVKALRRAGDKLIATLSQVPEIVFKAIKSGRYKRVSSEVYWELKKGDRTHKRVLAAVALLGADVPAVSNLADLEAYLSQSTAPGAGSFGRVAAYAFTTDSHGTIIQEVEMDQKEYEAKLAAEKTAREKAEADAKAYKEKLDAQQKAQAKKAKASRKAEFKQFCEDQVKAGCMTPAARDQLCGDDAEHQYSDNGGFAISVKDFKAFMEAQGKLLPTGEKGYGGKGKGGGKQYNDAGVEVDAKAKAYAAEHKVGYVEAVGAVLTDDEDLAARYEALATVDKEAD